MGSDTPRTDGQVINTEYIPAAGTGEIVTAYFARTLERELAACRERERVLREALRNFIKASANYAKAKSTAEVAQDNFTNPKPDLDRLAKAMVALSDAETDARAALKESAK